MLARRSQGLVPGHRVEAHAVTLGYVALEGVRGGAQRRERGQWRLVVVSHRERRDEYLVVGVVEQYDVETQPLALLAGEVVCQVVSLLRQAVGQIVVQFAVRQLGYVGQRYGRRGVVSGEVSGHGYMFAIRSMMRRSGSGCQKPATRAAASSVRALYERRESIFDRCSSSWLGW